MYYQFIQLDTRVLCSIKMENKQINYLMKLFQDNEITIQKYYWTSKLDETHLELFEPKIYDAFNFNLDVIGDKQIILDVLNEFVNKKHIYEHLDKCLHEPLSETKIKEYAQLMIR